MHVKRCKECGQPTDHKAGCWCPYCSGFCVIQATE